MKHFVVGIDWYGPYRPQGEQTARARAIQDAALWNPAGLYCAVGRPNDSWHFGPLYVGLSTILAQRLRRHQTLARVEREAGIDEIWLGYAATAEQSGRRGRATPRTLDDAEACHIYAPHPEYNERRKLSPPLQPVTVLNRWWKLDGGPRLRRPHSRWWPDLLDYMGDHHRSRAVWFGGRVRAFNPRENPDA